MYTVLYVYITVTYEQEYNIFTIFFSFILNIKLFGRLRLLHHFRVSPTPLSCSDL